VHWGINGWQHVSDIDTRDTGLGVYIVDLPIGGLVAGETVQFTFYWLEQKTWEGQDYEVQLIE
jgi:glucoamylase